MVHGKAVAVLPLSNQGLGTFSPTELPYPPQASVFEARQLKPRLMDTPRSLAMRAQNRDLGTNFGIRMCIHSDATISNISLGLLRQQVRQHHSFELSQHCAFQQQHLELSAHGCLL